MVQAVPRVDYMGKWFSDYTGLSVGGRALDVVDDQEVNGASGRFELETELFLERGKQGRARGVG
jgi:hypothetical protein